MKIAKGSTAFRSVTFSQCFGFLPILIILTRIRIRLLVPTENCLQKDKLTHQGLKLFFSLIAVKNSPTIPLSSWSSLLKYGIFSIFCFLTVYVYFNNKHWQVFTVHTVAKTVVISLLSCTYRSWNIINSIFEFLTGRLTV